MREDRLYTRDEANAMLGELRERLARIREARRELIASARRIEKRVAEDGGGVSEKAWFEASASLKADVETLAEQGLILRDPENGLIDFPALVDDGFAFLCWRLGEAEVAFWHPPDTGFAGRRPLDG